MSATVADKIDDGEIKNNENENLEENNISNVEEENKINEEENNELNQNNNEENNNNENINQNDEEKESNNSKDNNEKISNKNNEEEEEENEENYEIKINEKIYETKEEYEKIFDEFDIIVDALFGFSFKGEIRQPFKTIIESMKKYENKIISIDIPSGFDIDKGNIFNTFIPKGLVSLTLPKLCSFF